MKIWYLPKLPMADIANDQSINQVTSDTNNDVNQNGSETMAGTQVFDLNDLEAITDTKTVFDEEAPQMQEWIN